MRAEGRAGEVAVHSPSAITPTIRGMKCPPIKMGRTFRPLERGIKVKDITINGSGYIVEKASGTMTLRGQKILQN
jgi:hypothetical protein